ncbi:MAG: hypothetical protein Q4G64_04795 [bacterium]|nr:hypothetical protein [bacterium]
MPGDPALPVSYSWWVPTLGAVLVLAAIAWVVFTLWKRRGPRPAGPINPGRLRSTYGDQIEGVYASFQRGEITLRDLHLKISEIVRDFGSKRAGRNLQVMSRREVEDVMPGTMLSDLLTRCEQPSFSRDPAAEAEQTVGMAREVISRW